MLFLWRSRLSVLFCLFHRHFEEIKNGRLWVYLNFLLILRGFSQDLLTDRQRVRSNEAVIVWKNLQIHECFLMIFLLPTQKKILNFMKFFRHCWDGTWESSSSLFMPCRHVISCDCFSILIRAATWRNAEVASRNNAKIGNRFESCWARVTESRHSRVRGRIIEKSKVDERCGRWNGWKSESFGWSEKEFLIEL